MTSEMKDSGIKWIGQIPKEWGLKRMKYILKERKLKNDPIITKEILSLSIERGVFPYSEKTGGGNKAKEDLTAYKVTYPGDIVINSMNILAGAVGLSKYEGAVSPVYYTLYADSNDIDIRYYYYLFQTEAFQKSLLGLGNGIMMKESSTGKLNTIRMRIPMEKLSALVVPLPSRETQKKIINRIKGKVEFIDKIIFETKQSIDELGKYKQSIITEAVSKGLDKNVKMKDSGIEWIGVIPFNWSIRMVGNYFHQVKNKNQSLEEANLLSLSYGSVIRRDINSSEGLLPDNFSGYNIVEPGDIVLRMTDLQNDHKSLRTGLVNERGIITSAYITIRSDDTSTVNTQFVQFLLHSFDIQKGFYGMGSGVRQNVTFNDIKKLPIVVPPVNVQHAIVKHLLKKIERIDDLIRNKQQLINEHKQYKKSIIYEYVTGKKEI